MCPIWVSTNTSGLNRKGDKIQTFTARSQCKSIWDVVSAFLVPYHKHVQQIGSIGSRRRANALLTGSIFWTLRQRKDLIFVGAVICHILFHFPSPSSTPLVCPCMCLISGSVIYLFRNHVGRFHRKFPIRIPGPDSFVLSGILNICSTSLLTKTCLMTDFHLPLFASISSLSTIKRNQKIRKLWSKLKIFWIKTKLSPKKHIMNTAKVVVEISLSCFH